MFPEPGVQHVAHGSQLAFCSMCEPGGVFYGNCVGLCRVDSELRKLWLHPASVLFEMLVVLLALCVQAPWPKQKEVGWLFFLHK